MPELGRTRVVVIGGGTSDEHEVSLASAAAVARAVEELDLEAVRLTIARDGGWLDEDGAPLPPHRAVQVLTHGDIAFPTLHGVGGEDGAVAGLLELCGVPYVGSPVAAGAFGIDKWVTKLIADALGIATARGVFAGAADDATTFGIEPPFVVKPATGGSSNGVTVVPRRDDVAEALRSARAFGRRVLVEEYVRGREVDVAVFRDARGNLRIGSTLEIGVAPGAVFGREVKYDGSAQFTLPARISAEEERAIGEAAELLYEALGCGGVARFDFFATPEGIVLNEINTAPGMTERSQVPLMYAAVGMEYPRLISELLEAARRAPIREGSGA